mmetsp:Transcript_18926/g.47264  ORF Transcript_18926/g.47264 Transcript_18926/m.47264 type:complete len:352 (-) Transcript_18926:1311-2366(-)
MQSPRRSPPARAVPASVRGGAVVGAGGVTHLGIVVVRIGIRDDLHSAALARASAAARRGLRATGGEPTAPLARTGRSPCGRAGLVVGRGTSGCPARCAAALRRRPATAYRSRGQRRLPLVMRKVVGKRDREPWSLCSRRHHSHSVVSVGIVISALRIDRRRPHPRPVLFRRNRFGWRQSDRRNLGRQWRQRRRGRSSAVGTRARGRRRQCCRRRRRSPKMNISFPAVYRLRGRAAGPRRAQAVSRRPHHVRGTTFSATAQKPIRRRRTRPAHRDGRAAHTSFRARAAPRDRQYVGHLFVVTRVCRAALVRVLAVGLFALLTAMNIEGCFSRRRRTVTTRCRLLCVVCVRRR